MPLFYHTEIMIISNWLCQNAQNQWPAAGMTTMSTLMCYCSITTVACIYHYLSSTVTSCPPHCLVPLAGAISLAGVSMLRRYDNFSASFQASKQSATSGPLHQNWLGFGLEDPWNSSRNDVWALFGRKPQDLASFQRNCFLANSMPILPWSPLIFGVSQASWWSRYRRWEKARPRTEMLPIFAWSRGVFKNRECCMPVYPKSHDHPILSHDVPRHGFR